MKAEVWRSGDTGYGVEESRHGMIRDGDQAWHWGSHAINSLVMVSYKNCTSGAGQNLL